jgi:hypothetical protein
VPGRARLVQPVEPMILAPQPLPPHDHALAADELLDLRLGGEVLGQAQVLLGGGRGTASSPPRSPRSLWAWPAFDAPTSSSGPRPPRSRHPRGTSRTQGVRCLEYQHPNSRRRWNRLPVIGDWLEQHCSSSTRANH